MRRRTQGEDGDRSGAQGFGGHHRSKEERWKGPAGAHRHGVAGTYTRLFQQMHQKPSHVGIGSGSLGFQLARRW